MSLVLGVRFPALGESTPLIIAEKTFEKDYGHFGEEKEVSTISIVFFEQVHNDKMYLESAKRIDELFRSGKIKDAKLLADYTVSGPTAIGMLREKRLLTRPFLIGAQSDNGLGGFTVPEKDLISSVQRILAEGRLKFASGLEGAEELIGELSRPYREDNEYTDAALCLCAVAWYSNQYVRQRDKHKMTKWPKAGRL